ncbi:MAG: hypothetical protein AB7T22_07555, partial [Calditrichaceae bacterium]
AFRKTLELNSGYPGVYPYLTLIHLAKNNPASALAEIRKESDPAWRLFGLALTYHDMGQRELAMTELKTAIRDYQDDFAYQIAEIYAYMGIADKAFEWLERAFQQHDGGLTEMKGDPLLRNIEKDERYMAFMKKMNLPL